MIQFARGATCVGLGFCMVIAALGCSSESSESPGSSQSDLVMSLTFEPVEARAGAVASFSARWEQVRRAELGTSRAALTSYASSVSLANDPANPVTFDSATDLLQGGVILTNTGGTALDEPRVMITSIYGGCDPNCGAIQFLATDNGNGNGVGANYAYPDVSAAGGAAPSSRRIWSVLSPNEDPFSFDIDVLAEDAPISVVLDSDDDFYNAERGEPGGGDCDDSDDSEFPGGNTCPNPGSCSVTSCAVPVAGCCEETCASGNCTRDCDAGNTCFFTAAAGENSNIYCEPGSSCTVTHPSPNRARIRSCTNAACDLTCNGGSGLRCLYANEVCVDSACSLSCDGQSVCLIRSCDGDSACSVKCSNSDERCGINNCDNTSATCMVECGVNVSNCRLRCDVGSSIDCGGGVLVCPGTPCP